MSVLYVVATPIGNLEDISLRALRVLREVSLIAAEDTRKTRRLLEKYEIKTPLTSYYEQNKETKLDYLMQKLEEGDIAIVSEAGVPGISDPGYELVSAAIGRGMQVVPVPGPSAVISALSVSGLPADRFCFIGFLPRKAGERRRFLKALENEPGSIVILEAPHRLAASLRDILEVLGDRRMAVCRELTKLHEEVFRGTLSQAISRFAEPKGEFTLVIEGNKTEEKGIPNTEIERRLEELQVSGVGAKEAVACVASQTGLSKKELYRAWLKLP